MSFKLFDSLIFAYFSILEKYSIKEKFLDTIQIMIIVQYMKLIQQENYFLVTAEKYAELVGLPIGVVRGQLDRRQLPVYKVGKRRFINLVKLRMDLAGSVK